MYYFLEETTSTNDDARQEQYLHGDVICAERQTAGRGQRGHSWQSGQGLNLTFSLVLEPRFLPVEEQFLLSEVVALGLLDAFAHYGLEALIKWTNDVYLGDKKAIGILIEHHYAGQHLSRTVVGIGINVNQTEFDPALPNPTSMAGSAGRQFDRREVLTCCCEQIMSRFGQLQRGEKESLQADYRTHMYRLGELHTFRYANGEATRAAIQGVRPSGELILQHQDGTVHEYLFKEIEFVL